MDFGLSEDQREIQRTARELLAERARPDRVREHAEASRTDERLWRELCELGWPGIAIAEEYGGQGLGRVELSILCEELGRSLAPVPFLPTVLAATVIEHTGSEEQRARWLPALASGERVGALGEARDGIAELVIGAAEPVGGATEQASGATEQVDGAAEHVGGATERVSRVTEQVSGAADHASEAADAQIVLVEGDTARVVTGADAQVEPLACIDPTRSAARVSAPAGVGETLSGKTSAGIDRALVAVASELVGVCERALEMTVAYVKERKQFGVPVGSYQAVSHRCAQMLLDTEKARSTAAFAAWTADAHPLRLGEAATMAKAAASDAGREVTAGAIQAHGGIGFTWEADVHWLYKRAQVDAALLGGAKHHRARLAAILAGSRPSS